MWDLMGTLYQRSTPNKFTIYKLYHTIILQGLNRVSYMFVFKELFDFKVRIKLKILKEKRFNARSSYLLNRPIYERTNLSSW